MMSSSSSRGHRWTPASQQGRERLDSSRWRNRAPSVVRWPRRLYGRPRLEQWTASRWWAQSPPGGCRRWRQTMLDWARTAGEAVIPRAATPPTSPTRRKLGAVVAEEAEELWPDLGGSRATLHQAGKWGQPGSALPRPRATDTPGLDGVRPRPPAYRPPPQPASYRNSSPASDPPPYREPPPPPGSRTHPASPSPGRQGGGGRPPPHPNQGVVRPPHYSPPPQHRERGGNKGSSPARNLSSHNTRVSASPSRGQSWQWPPRYTSQSPNQVPFGFQSEIYLLL